MSTWWILWPLLFEAVAPSSQALCLTSIDWVGLRGGRHERQLRKQLVDLARERDDYPFSGSDSTCPQPSAELLVVRVQLEIVRIGNNVQLTYTAPSASASTMHERQSAARRWNDEDLLREDLAALSVWLRATYPAEPPDIQQEATAPPAAAESPDPVREQTPLERAIEPKHRGNTAMWTLLVTGGVCLVTSAALEGVAYYHYGEMQEKLPLGGNKHRRLGESFQTGAVVAAAVGAASAGVGVVLWLVDDEDDSQARLGLAPSHVSLTIEF